MYSHGVLPSPNFMVRKIGSGFSFIVGIIVSFVLVGSGIAGHDINDAYIRAEEGKWVFGTATVERTVVLEKGKLISKSFKHKNFNIEVIGQPSSGKILTGGEPEQVTGRTSICIDGFRIEK